MAGVEVREARPGEGTALAECKRRSWQAAYRGQLPDDVLDGLGLVPPPDVWEQAIASPRPPFVAVDDRGVVVGMAAVGMARDEDGAGRGELFLIYADAAVWGTGVGHALHTRCVDALAALGVDEAVLWVLAGNDRAIAFYEAHGWAADGTTTDDEIDGAPVILQRMGRAIPG